MVEKEYRFELERYMSRERFNRIRDFANDKETPCLVIDLAKIGQNYDELLETLPFAKIYYAVKANP